MPKMKFLNIIFCFAVSRLALFPSTASAVSIECTLNIRYNGNSTQITQTASSAESATANAIRSGCFKLCPTNFIDNSCIKTCFKSSKISSVQCFDENKKQVFPNKNKAKKILADSSKISIKHDNNNKSPNQLILTQWTGNNKKKAQKNSLLLRNPNRPPIDSSRIYPRPPLLLH